MMRIKTVLILWVEIWVLKIGLKMLQNNFSKGQSFEKSRSPKNGKKMEDRKNLAVHYTFPIFV